MDRALHRPADNGFRGRRPSNAGQEQSKRAGEPHNSKRTRRPGYAMNNQGQEWLRVDICSTRTLLCFADIGFRALAPRPGFAGPPPPPPPPSGSGRRRARGRRRRRKAGRQQVSAPPLFGRGRCGSDRSGPDRRDVCTRTTYPPPVTLSALDRRNGGKAGGSESSVYCGAGPRERAEAGFQSFGPRPEALWTEFSTARRMTDSPPITVTECSALVTAV